MKRLAVLLILLFLVGSAAAVTESYVSQYPPAFNDTYVNSTTVFNISRMAYIAMNSSTSLTGVIDTNGWMAAEGGATTNQKFNIDLGAEHTISRIYYQNFHHIGVITDRGVKNFTLWASNSEGAFLNLTYTNSTGWTQLTTSVSNFSQHVGTNTSDPQYFNVTPNGTHQYYSFRFADNFGGSSMGLRRLELQSAISWEYDTAGSYTWQCPENVTEVITQMVGGGGGGRGPSATGYNYWFGWGGSHGEYQSFSHIAVTPGENYTIIVGAQGAASLAGSSSSAFGDSVAGGAPGTVGDMIAHDGGDGDTGYINSERYAANGTDAGSFFGGISGLGFGAGGGGSAADYTLYGAAGAGAGGYVMIYDSGAGVPFNVPEFSATPVTGIAGTLVRFTDESTINDEGNLSYLWDFGDGDTTATIGDVQHVFQYIGSYDVSLTITSDGGTVSEEKEAYINLIAAELRMNTYSPRTVAFTILDLNSVPVTDAVVNASISSSTFPNGYQDLIDFYGMTESAAISALNTVSVMEGTTDSTGGVVFTMLSSAKYVINITSNGTVYSQSIYPQDPTYTIRITSSGYDAPFTGVNATDYASTTRLTFSEPNMSYITLGIDFQDLSGKTDHLQFFIKTVANDTVVYSYSQNVTGTERIVINKTYLNIRGEQWSWHYDAHRTV